MAKELFSIATRPLFLTSSAPALELHRLRSLSASSLRSSSRVRGGAASWPRWWRWMSWSRTWPYSGLLVPEQNVVDKTMISKERHNIGDMGGTEYCVGREMPTAEGGRRRRRGGDERKQRSEGRSFRRPFMVSGGATWVELKDALSSSASLRRFAVLQVHETSFCYNPYNN